MQHSSLVPTSQVSMSQLLSKYLRPNLIRLLLISSVVSPSSLCSKTNKWLLFSCTYVLGFILWGVVSARTSLILHIGLAKSYSPSTILQFPIQMCLPLWAPPYLKTKQNKRMFTFFLVHFPAFYIPLLGHIFLDFFFFWIASFYRSVKTYLILVLAVF